MTVTLLIKEEDTADMLNQNNLQLAETHWAIGQFYCVMEADTVFHVMLPEIPVRYSRQVFAKKRDHIESLSTDIQKICDGTGIFSLFPSIKTLASSGLYVSLTLGLNTAKWSKFTI